MIKYIAVPVSEVMQLLVYPEQARINVDNTLMLAIDDGVLHVLQGDFTGIDAGADLGEILRRNLE